MSKMAYIILRITLHQRVELRQLRCLCKVNSNSLRMQHSSCFNSPRAPFCDFYKIPHESRFARPSKTPQNVSWYFWDIFVPLR